MRDLFNDIRGSAGTEPEPSDFAKTAKSWPDKETEPEKYAEAKKASEKYHSFVLTQFSVVSAIVWASLGFVGAQQGLTVVVGFSSETRALLQAGDLTIIILFLVSLVAAGLAFFVSTKYRLLGALEIGAALGAAFYGFAESGSSLGAIFIYLAGVIAIADGFSRLFRVGEKSHE